MPGGRFACWSFPKARQAELLEKHFCKLFGAFYVKFPAGQLVDTFLYFFESAGELSGKLDQILDSLGIMLEKDMELNRQIKSSVRYPLIVLLAITGAFAVLVTFVIPRFVTFYSNQIFDLYSL